VGCIAEINGRLWKMVGRCPRARGYGVTPNAPLFFIVSLFDVYDTLCNFETTLSPFVIVFLGIPIIIWCLKVAFKLQRKTLDGHVRRILWEQVPP